MKWNLTRQIMMSRSRKDLEEEVILLDTMLSSLVQILEEKGIIKNSEFEGRVKENSCR
jgi:hypothetical protein